MAKDKTKKKELEHHALVEAAIPENPSAETTVFVQFCTASEKKVRSDSRDANGTC
jgi:hypothetical protein